ncbi:MAG: RNA 2',3'-cyclic phosphodiesterase [Candidatus Bathyarchaeota archaeon]|nr:RNA 2',3'-cyclic phosphodiesterase [Candidatus Bathyarchaeota archaeon]MCZ2844943.1 RNA 2',3'-cyclic phosphodiesterase [Candidatus Bathyarchaeota archaeon]
MKTERIRSFISFDISSEKILKKIQEVQEKLVQTEADLRIVKPKNIHITMRFLGEISTETVEKVIGQMKEIKSQSFDIEFKGIGTFPNIKYPRVIWIGIKKGSIELKEIFAQLESRLTKIGFNPDKKGFNPHLTIARVRSGRNRQTLTDALGHLELYEIGIIRAEILKLKRSTLTPNGPIYSTMHEVVLDSQ